MKKKQKIILTAAIIFVIMAIPAVWYFFPTTFLREIEPSDVKSIAVASGTTGNSFVVEDRAEIEYIVDSIQGVIMRKNSISEGKKGWRFHVKFYDGDGNELDSFFVEGEYMIRKDPFYYRGYRRSGRLCFYYLTELEKKYTE